jgi:hypothetical protein
MGELARPRQAGGISNRNESAETEREACEDCKIELGRVHCAGESFDFSKQPEFAIAGEAGLVHN